MTEENAAHHVLDHLTLTPANLRRVFMEGEKVHTLETYEKAQHATHWLLLAILRWEPFASSSTGGASNKYATCPGL